MVCYLMLRRGLAMDNLLLPKFWEVFGKGMGQVAVAVLVTVTVMIMIVIMMMLIML